MRERGNMEIWKTEWETAMSIKERRRKFIRELNHDEEFKRKAM